MSVAAAANPSGASVDVGIGFVGAGGRTTQLAPVSLYPIDRPMKTRLRLPPGRGRLVFTLLGQGAPLIIRIGPIAWRQSEP